MFGLFPEIRFFFYFFMLNGNFCKIGVEVKISLTPNDNKICIDSYDGASANYMIKIQKVVLHVPIGQVRLYF